MFCRGVSWSVSIFVAVVIATAYSNPVIITESPRVVAVRDGAETTAARLKPTPGTRLAALRGVRRPTPTPPPHRDHRRRPATSTAPPLDACNFGPLNATAVSLLRNLSQEEKDRRLIKAAKEGSAEELQALLIAGADVGARDDYLNSTALHWAAYSGYVDTVECLVESGAAVNARNNRQATPLHFATVDDCGNVVWLLARLHADLNARDVDGRTPLHWAALRLCWDSVDLLLREGADKQVRDRFGDTPLAYLERLGLL